MIRKTLRITLFALLAGVFACVEEDNPISEEPKDTSNMDTAISKPDTITVSEIKILGERLYHNTNSFFEVSKRKDQDIKVQILTGGPWKNYGSVLQMSGEVVAYRPLEVNTSMIPGNWDRAVNKNKFANPDFFKIWDDMWDNVYASNLILEQMDCVSPDSIDLQERNQIKGEAFAFRALAYHEIFKRWGPMPYLKSRVPEKIDLNFERPVADTVTNNIVADCDSAIAFLPEVSYLNDPVNQARIGKVAAMALKSRALTNAASPNFNKDNNTELWDRAAKAAWDVIELSRSEAKVGMYGDDYNDIFYGTAGTIEGLWPRYREPRSSNAYHLNYLWRNGGNAGGAIGSSPTQELVDRFETADGWPIEHASSGYTEDNPYFNRDPRFYKDILYHGAVRAKFAEGEVIDMISHDSNENLLTPAELQEQDKDRNAPNPTDFGNSKTGYLISKIVPDKFNPAPAFRDRTVYLNMPYIRMAEIYLNYAEAVNEGTANPQNTVPGADLTAVQALNIIRDRVGQAEIQSEFTADQSQFRERVRNEFWVELCFEHHLWFDMLRWRTAEEELHGNNFTGMFLIPDNSKPIDIRFERFELPSLNRTFEDKHYLYPLRSEVLMSNEKLQQNPGW